MCTLIAAPSAARRAPIANASEDPTTEEAPQAPVAAKSMSCTLFLQPPPVCACESANAYVAPIDATRLQALRHATENILRF